MCVRPVRQATGVMSRCRITRERLGVMSTMLLIERCVVLLLVHRRSQALGVDSVQRVVMSRRALQSVVVNTREGVVVKRADVARIETAMIHTRLAVVVDRRCALHLTTKVRRTLMHLVLSATKTPNVSTTDMATTETTTTHVTTATTHVTTTATHVTTTAVSSSSAMTSTATASTVAVAGRQALKAEQ